MNIPRDCLALMNAVLRDHRILDGDIYLFAGWIHTESAFDPWALRYEPYFRWLPTTPMSPTETMGRKCSWGLLQMMGQVAREAGFDGSFPQLCDPKINLNLAAKILRYRRARTPDWDGALAAYNGGLGGNMRRPYRNQEYVDRVKANAERYGWDRDRAP
jgi:soluble lytic murein transglycosylase-like protein